LTPFQSFGLAEPIARALAEEKHLVPTPIQTQTVPLALSGRDIIGIAQTGTGKTAAFALPILHHLSAKRIPAERKSCRVLVLSPTRELSSQILDSFRAYGRHIAVTSALAIGGVPMGKQVRALQCGVDVLVATPGRLLDLVQSNALRLNRVDYLVLDEADRMLDMGFIHDIRKITAKLPAQRQTLLFSATMPQAIAELAAAMLRNPAKVAVTPVASTVDRVTQRIVHVDRQGKSAVLADLLRDEPIDRALVFTRTKHGADKLVRGLGKDNIRAEAIHGNKSQKQRERVLSAFRQGHLRILVATDIAARGIDVEGISHVVNYDLPNEPESYVHRIGRTARAGASGTAISLCDADEMPYLRSIEKLIRMSLPATSAALRRRSGPVPTTQSATKPRRRRSRAAKSDVSDFARLIAAEVGQGRLRGAENRHHDDRALGQPRNRQQNSGRAGPNNTPHATDFGPSGGHHAHAGHSAVPGHPVHDLSRVAFLNRSVQPAAILPHRRSTGVRKHGEGRAD
jgi:ATP-dependent RNA helicase RhlE